MDVGNVSQESLAGPILFMFIIEMEEALDQTPVKLPDDIKQVRAAVILSCEVAIQKNLPAGRVVQEEPYESEFLQF